jgi:hypothetical protein
MPRKNQLDQTENEILERLRCFRKRTGLPRIAFAQKAGVDSSALGIPSPD